MRPVKNDEILVYKIECKNGTVFYCRTKVELDRFLSRYEFAGRAQVTRLVMAEDKYWNLPASPTTAALFGPEKEADGE